MTTVSRIPADFGKVLEVAKTVLGSVGLPIWNVIEGVFQWFWDTIQACIYACFLELAWVKDWAAKVGKTVKELDLSVASKAVKYMQAVFTDVSFWKRVHEGAMKRKENAMSGGIQVSLKAYGGGILQYLFKAGTRCCVKAFMSTGKNGNSLSDESIENLNDFISLRLMNDLSMDTSTYAEAVHTD